ncbi:hypothetical protein BD413DRAFT_522775 [Trametes elegans]|nr:hypothetical protein BD413DRAFT_522775 [Trametes elegans]
MARHRWSDVRRPQDQHIHRGHDRRAARRQGVVEAVRTSTAQPAGGDRTAHSGISRVVRWRGS